MELIKSLPPLKQKAFESIISTSRKISPIAIEARDNFAVFYQYLFEKPMQPHHWRIVEALCTYKSNDTLKYIAGPHTNILMPRAAAKSTVGRYWLTWVIGNNPEIKIILLSYNEASALSFSRNVRNIIENNEKYNEVFPEIIKGTYWNEKSWQIDVTHATGNFPEVDYTMIATGIDGGISGKRSNLIFCDDLIKNTEQIAKSEIREKRRENWYQAILPTLLDGGRIVDLGTRYHPQDEHATLFTEKNGYEIIRQSAIITDGDGVERSYWEDQHPYKKLCQKRSEDPIAFSYQYQNLAIVKSSESFKPEWIRRCEALPIDQYATLCVGIDLASTVGIQSDYTVFMLCGSTHTGDYHIIDYVRGKWIGNQEKLGVLMELLYEHGIIEETEINGKMDWLAGDVPCNIIPELVAYQNSFRGDFNKYAHEDRELYNLISTAVKAPRSTKGQRFLGVTGMFEAGKVYFNAYKNMSALTSELIGFGALEHDDLVDALVMSLTFLRKRKPISVTWV